jgi:hypothetical protein
MKILAIQQLSGKGMDTFITPHGLSKKPSLCFDFLDSPNGK